jgi:ribosomal protein S18 acetylase RimI-like enzyme
MSDPAVARVRRFNRFITQYVGALDDHFLARDRPLGEARLLWEIGTEGRELRGLRAQLGLDSGYLSRMLRALEGAGLVAVDAEEGDGRVRVARLTAAGLQERAVLDRRSDEQAGMALASLSAGQRARLVAAMTDVERLLSAAQVDIAPLDPAHPHARFCRRAFFAELERRFPEGFDPGDSLPLDEEHQRPPAGVLLVATLHGEPVGCGAVLLDGPGPAKIRRMWVAEAVRGMGIGRRLLQHLEAHAAGRGAVVVRLETHRSLTEAIALYRSSGYREVAPFSDERYAGHWFEKRLA